MQPYNFPLKKKVSLSNCERKQIYDALTCTTASFTTFGGNVQETLFTSDLSLHTGIIIREWHVDLMKEQQEGEIKIERGGIRRKKRRAHSVLAPVSFKDGR